MKQGEREGENMHVVEDEKLDKIGVPKHAQRDRDSGTLSRRPGQLSNLALNNVCFFLRLFVFSVLFVFVCLFVFLCFSIILPNIWKITCFPTILKQKHRKNVSRNTNKPKNKQTKTNTNKTDKQKNNKQTLFSTRVGIFVPLALPSTSGSAGSRRNLRAPPPAATGL